MRGLAALTFATLLTACYSRRIARDEPGSSDWTRQEMETRAAADLDCSRDALQHSYLGRLTDTPWHRHRYSGCGSTKGYWTRCADGRCEKVTVALEDRAALDFDCDASRIELRAGGNAVRATGCGQSSVYVHSSSGWVENREDGRRRD